MLIYKLKNIQNVYFKQFVQNDLVMILICTNLKNMFVKKVLTISIHILYEMDAITVMRKL